LPPSMRFACAASSDPWPVNPREPTLLAKWVADRNMLQADGVRSPFYNAASGLYASEDGRIQDRAGEPVPGAEGWGSDLASVDNPCGPNPLVIAAMAGDSPARDQVQVFEVINGQVAARSEPISLPGPVTALWASEMPGHASLVVRNSRTGNY